jgi:hypothetical protein
VLPAGARTKGWGNLFGGLVGGSLCHWVWFFPVYPSCTILPGLNLSFHA